MEVGKSEERLVDSCRRAGLQTSKWSWDLRKEEHTIDDGGKGVDWVKFTLLEDTCPHDTFYIIMKFCISYFYFYFLFFILNLYSLVTGLEQLMKL